MTAPLNVWAIGVVRNEADILRLTVRHHLQQGVTRFLFLDNGSTDTTPDVLDELRLLVPLEWRRHDGPFLQNELMTALAQEAFVRGADWVLPLDADEFWWAPGGTIPDVLERARAGALRVQLVNFVQRRDRLTPSADALLTMTRRIDRPIGEIQEIESLVRSNTVAYVEHQYVPKWIARTCPTLEIMWGSHFLSGAIEPLLDTDEIVCLHAPLRSRATLEQKIDAARPVDELSEYVKQAWHVRRWREIAERGELDSEWKANSYLDDALDLHGYARPLIVDTRLRDLVKPWLTPEPSWPPFVDDPEQPTADVPLDRARLRELLTAKIARGGSVHVVLTSENGHEAALERSLEATGKELLAARLECARLQERLAASERAGDELRTRLAASQADARQDAARADVRRVALIARVNELAAELQRTQGEVRALRTSWSWRLAAPLRWGLEAVYALNGNQESRGSGQSVNAPLAGPSSASMPAAVIRERPVEPVANLVAATLPGPSSPRILVISDVVPTPDLDAGSFRLHQVLLQLSAIGHSVTFCANSGSSDARYDESLNRAGIEIVKGRESTLKHLADAGQRYQYVVLSRPEIAFDYLFAVRAHAVHARVVFDTVDLHWVRLQGEARLTNAPELEDLAEKYASMELFNARSSDVTITVSEAERQMLLDRDASLQVEVIPVIHPVVPRKNAWNDRRDLMFVGSFWHKPNADAVVHFVREVLPGLRDELPDVVFNILGSRVPDEIKALGSSSVRCIGYAKDLTPHFEAARVFVAPLRFGAGVKGKIVQSMSHGVPVVTTSVGAAGLMVTSGDQVMVADTPDAFVRAVVSLYTDGVLWHAVSARASAHVGQYFSDTASRTRLARIFPPGTGCRAD